MSSRKGKIAEAPFVEHFASLPDPRVERTKRHCLHDILVIAVCGVICGADDWVAIARFGRMKEDWFRSFLELPNGIPSHDTFGRVFASLDPSAFSGCFMSWINALAEKTEGEVVAIDGKTLRRSFDRASGTAAIHMVSAWCAANQLLLGQVKTEEKSNEITAIPKLLEMLDLRGRIITIDAMGCQREIASKIKDKGADYVLGLKGNQGNLHVAVEAYFEQGLQAGFVNTAHAIFEEKPRQAHGRVERRKVISTGDLKWFEKHSDWAGLSSIAMVESERTVNGKQSIERRYYISSLPGDDAELIARAVRTHWEIENCVHWVLDVAFREDDSRVRKDNGAENLATLRHIALNLLKNEKTAKVGVKNKRLSAGWDENYLLKVLGL